MRKHVQRFCVSWSVVGSRDARACFFIALSFQLGACKLSPRDKGATVERIARPYYLLRQTLPLPLAKLLAPSSQLIAMTMQVREHYRLVTTPTATMMSPMPRSSTHPKLWPKRRKAKRMDESGSRAAMMLASAGEIYFVLPR